MIQLTRYDLNQCVRRLPLPVFQLLKRRPDLAVAGGFIRAVVAGEKVSDVDIMCPTPDAAAACAWELSKACGNAKVHETDNALTVKIGRVPAQFIRRWTFSSMEDAVSSFDFTIARAAFWCAEDGTWRSTADPHFYEDLAAKRLVYCSPVRIEEAGGSMLRVLKFYQRGYRIPLDSLGAVIARLSAALDLKKLGGDLKDERQVARVVTGLLREVDPSIDPEHEAHLSPADEPAEPDAPSPNAERSDS